MSDGLRSPAASAARHAPTPADIAALDRIAERLARGGYEPDAAALARLAGRVLPIPARGAIEVGGPGALGIVIEGCACRQRHLPDGTRRILGLYMPGEVALLTARNHQPDGLAALSACRIAPIPARALAELAETRPGIARILARLVERDARLTREWLVNAGRPAPRRVAHLLCEILERNPPAPAGGDFLGNRITQADLADMAHTSHVHMNRALRTLVGEGLLHCVRRRLGIHDPGRLAAYGGFDPAYLRDDPVPTVPTPVGEEEAIPFDPAL